VLFLPPKVVETRRTTIHTFSALVLLGFVVAASRT